MKLNVFKIRGTRQRNSAFTLVEIVIATFLTAMVFSGIIMANTQAARRAHWSGYQLAAQALAIHQLEQARAAVWYTRPWYCEIDDLTLTGKTTSSGVIRGYTVAKLDVPTSGALVFATNFVMIKPIPLSTNIQLRMVRVDTVWPFIRDNKKILYTNSVATYLAPDDL